jgi:hypothetical protein
MDRLFKERDSDYSPCLKYKNPVPQKIIRACCRLETACNLIEHKTNAPGTIYFCISKAFEELNDAIKKYYGDHPDFGIWNIK